MSEPQDQRQRPGESTAQEKLIKISDCYCFSQEGREKCQEPRKKSRRTTLTGKGGIARDATAREGCCESGQRARAGSQEGRTLNLCTGGCRRGNDLLLRQDRNRKTGSLVPDVPVKEG